MPSNRRSGLARGSPKLLERLREGLAALNGDLGEDKRAVTVGELRELLGADDKDSLEDAFKKAVRRAKDE